MHQDVARVQDRVVDGDRGVLAGRHSNDARRDGRFRNRIPARTRRTLLALWGPLLARDHAYAKGPSVTPLPMQVASWQACRALSLMWRRKGQGLAGVRVVCGN